MATFTRPAQLLAHMQRRADTHVRSMRDAHRELWRGGVRDHAALTGGGVSTRQLRAMGHPFGRTAPGDPTTGVRGIQGRQQPLTGKAARKNQVRKGVLQPLPINKQTGRLRRSFYATPEVGPDLTVEMGFRAPHARYVLSPTGTRRMVARGFYSVQPGSMAGMGEIARRHRARKAGIIASARKRMLQIP